MAGRSTGPAQLVLLASVARRYYLEGRSKVEIADELGLSRFKVARLIEEAKETGLVRIEIRGEGVLDIDLSARLRERFGLQHAVVVDTPDEDPALLRQQLGLAGAELLGEIVTPDDVLGLAWARSVSAMAGALPPIPPVPVVQLTGALSREDGDHSSIDLVRDVARAAGGPVYVFYAPFVLPDAATARALRQQTEVARALAQFPRVTKAVVGIGSWGPGDSTLYDSADPGELEELRRLGVCAELSGVFLTQAGGPVETGFAHRLIGLDAQQMRVIPEVVVIAYGMAKVPAMRAALRSGLVGGVITHTTLARTLLDGA